MKSRKEFEGCTVIEKCDDGFSGTHFDNRPQFTEMIELAKKGKIDCIIVKDDCVIIERNTESPEKCGFCGVCSVF